MPCAVQIGLKLVRVAVIPNAFVLLVVTLSTLDTTGSSCTTELLLPTFNSHI